MILILYIYLRIEQEEVWLIAHILVPYVIQNIQNQQIKELPKSFCGLINFVIIFFITMAGINTEHIVGNYIIVYCIYIYIYIYPLEMDHQPTGLIIFRESLDRNQRVVSCQTSKQFCGFYSPHQKEVRILRVVLCHCTNHSLVTTLILSQDGTAL